MWVATGDLPKSVGHPFYTRLNRLLDEAGFDTFVEGLCAKFYAATVGRPSLAPGRYFRVYPGFPIRLGALPGFVVGDRMWNALWKLVENEQRFPRRGGRVLCVHGAVSFHRARPCVRPVCRPGSTRAPLNRIVKIVTNRASRYRHRTTSLS